MTEMPLNKLENNLDQETRRKLDNKIRDFIIMVEEGGAAELIKDDLLEIFTLARLSESDCDDFISINIPNIDRVGEDLEIDADNLEMALNYRLFNE